MTVVMQMAVGSSERKPQVHDPGPRGGPLSQPRQQPAGGLRGRAMRSQAVQVAQQTHHVVETQLNAAQGSEERVGIFQQAVAWRDQRAEQIRT